MINANEPAFPKAVPDGDRLQNGLTKREYFAAMAMQGLCSSNPETSDIELARVSVHIANALINELNK